MRTQSRTPCSHFGLATVNCAATRARPRAGAPPPPVVRMMGDTLTSRSAATSSRSLGTPASSSRMWSSCLCEGRRARHRPTPRRSRLSSRGLRRRPATPCVVEGKRHIPPLVDSSSVGPEDRRRVSPGSGISPEVSSSVARFGNQPRSCREWFSRQSVSAPTAGSFPTHNTDTGLVRDLGFLACRPRNDGRQSALAPGSAMEGL